MGRIRITVTKDRHGTVGSAQEPVADIVGEWREADGERWLQIERRAIDRTPKARQRQLLDLLADNPDGLTINKLAMRLGGRKKVLATQLAALEDAGSVTSSPGPRNSTVYAIPRPGTSPVTTSDVTSDREPPLGGTGHRSMSPVTSIRCEHGYPIHQCRKGC